MHLRLIAVASFLGLTALGLTACFAPPNMTDRLADASYNLNQAARFGRMDVALENVGLKVRDQFAKEHLHWGRAIRVVDFEMNGLSMASKDEADVFVAISWQRTDEATLRVTHLTQRWKSEKGTWRMDSEERKAGDYGLLGEHALVLEPEPQHAQFPTRVIHGE